MKGQLNGILHALLEKKFSLKQLYINSKSKGGGRPNRSETLPSETPIVAKCQLLETDALL